MAGENPSFDAAPWEALKGKVRQRAHRRCRGKSCGKRGFEETASASLRTLFEANEKCPEEFLEVKKALKNDVYGLKEDR